MKRLHTQTEWIERAKEVLPAGGFGNFDPGIIIARGQGSHVWDEAENRYIDYLIGSGPMLLGHGHPEVLEAVFEQLPQGMTFFATNSRGIELADAICEAVACCQQVRFVTSGGEADMYAIRLARAYTGKDKILKFEGGYHGMSAEAQMSLAKTRAFSVLRQFGATKVLRKTQPKNMVLFWCYFLRYRAVFLAALLTFAIIKRSRLNT